MYVCVYMCLLQNAFLLCYVFKYMPKSRTGNGNTPEISLSPLTTSPPPNTATPSTKIINPTSTGNNKIIEYKLEKIVLEGYAKGMSASKIAKLCTKRLKQHNEPTHVNYRTVRDYFLSLPKTMQTSIDERRAEILLSMAREWEATALDTRQDAIDQLEMLLSEYMKQDDDLRWQIKEDHKGKLSTSALDNLAKILGRIVKIQESGEQFLGIANKEGGRYAKPQARNDFIDQLKQRFRDKSIDVNAKDIEE